MAKNQAAATAALSAQSGGVGAAGTLQDQSGKQDGANSQTVQSTGEANKEQVQREGAYGAKRTTPPQTTHKRVRARVLVEGRFGVPNDVVEVNDDTLATAAGELCAHPASVAYALSLK